MKSKSISVLNNIGNLDASDNFERNCNAKKAKQAPCLILSHGAGAAMDSDFMNTMTTLLNECGIDVLRFEFPYMQQRRETGVKRLPDREEVLLATWRTVIAQYGSTERLFIGGKSLGGRIASMIADEADVKGVVCLGYPFHPRNKPERLRIAHLENIKTPVLMLQGGRDPLGSREEVSGYHLCSQVEFCWLQDGDHDLKPRVKSGFSYQHHLQCAAQAICGFISKRLAAHQ